jgi:hypothetical protein
MPQTNNEITPNLAERWCWEVARRDEARIARRLYRQPLVDGVYRLDEGAVLDDFCHVLDQVGVLALLAEVHGAAIQPELLPCIQYVMLYRLKTLFGIERMKALPALLCSDEARLQWVGCNAQQVRDGVCQRGAVTRQGERHPGPSGPDPLAKNSVKWDVRPLEAVCNGAIRAVAQAEVFGQQVTGIADGTDLETTEHDRGCGQATRKVRREDQPGQMPEIEVTGYGWTVLRLIDAATKIPLAVKVGQIQEHETHGTRALVTPARTKLAGAARLHTVVFDQGVWAGTDLWWLAQQGRLFVVPAKATMAVTAAARAPAAAGDGLTLGRRVHTGRHGQGKTARPERQATEVVGITGLTTDAQEGTAEHGRHAKRRDCQGNRINAVVVRTWHGRDAGPRGKPVFRTKASVETPLQPFDADDERRRIEHGGIKAAKQPWALGHPPQQTARAVRVHVLFTLLLFALAPAYRLPGEREATGGEPIGWQRWRRQLLEPTRNQVIVFAQGYDGLVHLAEYSLLLGGRLKDKPPGIDTYHDILAKYGLSSQP